MAVTNLTVLEDLKKQIPYKWREQSVNASGATCVAYIDARDLFNQLDEAVGSANWQSDFRVVDGKLFGGIGINIEGSGWVWKWDTGTESNVDKEKGEVSDAVKRAGVQWGIGRFLYSLGIVKLKSAVYKDKYRPADDSGNIIWDKDKLTELCNKAVKEGNLDRTRLTSAPAKAKATVTQSKKSNTDQSAKPINEGLEDILTKLEAVDEIKMLSEYTKLGGIATSKKELIDKLRAKGDFKVASEFFLKF